MGEDRAVGLTESQRRALAHIVAHPGCAPSEIGRAMMDGRETRTHRSAQGYGRIGGNMVARLKRDGLVYCSDPNGWPRYSASVAGRAALARGDAGRAGEGGYPERAQSEATKVLQNQIAREISCNHNDLG